MEIVEDRFGNSLKFRNPAVMIGLLGALIRLIFLWSSSNDTSFWHPLVDEKTYHDLALGFSATGWTDQFLWQAAFYPAFLTFIYETIGPYGLAAKVIQAMIGGFSCALTFQLGKEVFGKKAGVIAGLILAFYGPVMFFESRLLGTGWAIFWVALLGLLLIRLNLNSSLFLTLVSGAALALAVYTRPVLLIAGPLFAATILVSRDIRFTYRYRLIRLAVILAGFLAVVLPVSLTFKNLTGHFGLVPPSGGINLYIGNNRNYDQTINIRPGLEWAKLVAEPIKAGRDPNPWAGDPYFRDRALSFAKNDPGRAIKLIFEKMLTLFSSREIPRNLDIYLHREWSPVLSLSTWRIQKWGFPFGLMFPLAIVGVLWAKGRAANLAKLYIAGLGIATVVVFVSARYKVLLMPLLALFAAVGIVEIARLVSNKDRRRLIMTFLVLAACVLISAIPGPFAQERVDLRAEYYFGIGHDLYDREEWQSAAEFMAKSIALDPEVHASRQVMGIASARLHRYDDAVIHFQEAVRLRPGHKSTKANLDQALRERAREAFIAGKAIERSDPALAIDFFQRAANDHPKWYEPIAQLSFLFATTEVDSLRDGIRATALAQRAIKLRGTDDPYLVYILVAGLAEGGQFEEALDVADEATRTLIEGKDDEMLSRFRSAIGHLKAGEKIAIEDIN